MTNQNKKKKRPPGGYRNPGAGGASAKTAPAPRSGFLGSLFAPRVPGASSMPKIRTSLMRGAVAVLSSPVLVVAPVAIALLGWICVLLLGFQGPFSGFVNALALPPVGTWFDLNLATAVFGLRGGLIAILGFVVIRAAVLAVLVSLIVEVLDTDRISKAGWVGAMRVFPVAVSVNVIGMGLLTLASFLGPLLGAAFGLLVQVSVLVAGVYLFVFAPVIAAAERRSMPECIARSIRAARMPGAGNLGMAALYVIPAVALLAAPKPGSLIGVNPSVWAWVLVLVANLLHVVFLATFAFRYLSVTDEVPDAPERAARGRGFFQR